MKVFLDSIIFSLQKQGGISIYWSELLTRFSKDKNFNYEVRIYSKNQNENRNVINTLTQGKSFIVKIYKNIFPLFLLRFLPFTFLKKEKFIFHSSYLNTSVSFRKNINVLTIHDLGYESRITQSGFRRIVNISFKYLALRNADAIICISNFTQNELNKFYPFCKNKIQKVIYNGVSDKFHFIAKADYFSRYAESNYILFVGTRYEYKNFGLTLKILKGLSNYNLIVVGGGDFNSDENNLINNLGLRHRIRHLKSVTTDDLNNLYNGAHCLLYPSFYEGFGIPILESMKSGCPYVAYNIDSIREITNSEGLLLNINSTVSDFIDAILSLENKKFRKNLIEKGILRSSSFSWDKCYDETVKFYNELITYNK